MESDPVPPLNTPIEQAPAARAVGGAGLGRRIVLRWSLRLLLFWSPILLIGTGFELLLWRTGESWSLEHVIDAQRQGRNRRFLRLYFDQGLYRYKYLGLVERRPRILALGSSRVMRFRAPMFGDDARAFFNAGGMIQDLDDLESFVRLVPDSLMPRVIILGVDMWWLNQNYRSPEGLSSGIGFDGARSWQSHLLAARAMLLNRAGLGSAMRAAASGTRHEGGIGLATREHGSGFRADGSLASGLAVPRTNIGWRFVDREHPTIPERIRRGIEQFTPAPEVSASRLARLQAVLSALRRRGTLVLGFNPPLSSEAAAALQRDPRERELWVEYRTQVPALFAALGLPFVDASTPAALGLDDRYMVDGFHAEETFHLYLLRRFSIDPRVTAVLPSMGATVDRAIASPQTNYWYAALPRP